MVFTWATGSKVTLRPYPAAQNATLQLQETGCSIRRPRSSLLSFAEHIPHAGDNQQANSILMAIEGEPSRASLTPNRNTQFATEWLLFLLRGRKGISESRASADLPVPSRKLTARGLSLRGSPALSGRAPFRTGHEF